MKRALTMTAAAALAAAVAWSGAPVHAGSQDQPAGQKAMPMGQGMMGYGQGRGMMGPGMMGGQGYGMQQRGYGYGCGPMQQAPQQGGQAGQPPYGPMQGYGYGYGPMGPGMMHPQMHQWMHGEHGYGHPHGYGYGQGPGMMMGPGYMMGPGQMMGPGMMGPGYMMRPGYGRGAMGAPGGEVSTDNVKAMLEQRLAMHNNPNVKVGKVEEEDDHIVAEIVTKDGSLVNRFKVDKETGQWMPAN